MGERAFFSIWPIKQCVSSLNEYQ
uniref:Uncharacterized protein n=1 Tax=Anguilla anguilla TaxID=7936 RepID=A0A0E9RUB8_ANGAN